MKKQTAYMLIAVLIILQFLSLIKINSLQSRFENISNRIHAMENRIDFQIDSIYQNLEQKLEAQASVIHNSTAEIGKLDLDTLTVPVKFTVEPKTITDNLSVFLDFNGEIVPLEKSGLQYSIIKNFEISDNISPKIIIEDNGVKNIEEHQGLKVVNIREQALPRIIVRYSGSSTYGGNDYRAKGSLVIDYKPAQENNPIIKMKYVIKVDDKIIKEIPVEAEKDNGPGGTFALDIYDEYSLNDGEVLTSHVVAVDSFGFAYEHLVTHFVAGSRTQRVPYFKHEKIIAPNGEIVYVFDESNYEKIN